MNEHVSVAPARRAWRWWGALRCVLAAMWLLGAVITWWTAPRVQSYDQARADVAAGRVTAYQWGDRWDVDDSRRWFGASTLQSSDTLGPLFAWRTADGRVHWTDSRDFDQVTTTGVVDEASYSGAGAVGLAQDLWAAGLEDRAGDVDVPGGVVAGVELLLGVTFLGVVVAGPAPVRGTRWFWFWLVSGAPYGIGLLFWLLRDRPWSRRAAPAVHPGGPERRARGILGLGIAILLTILVGALLLALHGALGDRWIPSPGA